MNKMLAVSSIWKAATGQSKVYYKTMQKAFENDHALFGIMDSGNELFVEDTPERREAVEQFIKDITRRALPRVGDSSKMEELERRVADIERAHSARIESLKLDLDRAATRIMELEAVVAELKLKEVAPGVQPISASYNSTPPKTRLPRVLVVGFTPSQYEEFIRNEDIMELYEFQHVLPDKAKTAAIPTGANYALIMTKFLAHAAVDRYKEHFHSDGLIFCHGGASRAVELLLEHASATRVA